MLLQWEKDYSREFLVDDQRYIDTISEQWTAYNESKEQEKLKKLKETLETTMMQLKFGAKPRKAVTPSIAGDPAPNPVCKLRKVAPCPLVQATSLPRKTQGRTTPGKNVLTRQAHPASTWSRRTLQLDPKTLPLPMSLSSHRRNCSWCPLRTFTQSGAERCCLLFSRSEAECCCSLFSRSEAKDPIKASIVSLAIIIIR